jgi:hypothetical protein
MDDSQWITKGQPVGEHIDLCEPAHDDSLSVRSKVHHGGVPQETLLACKRSPLRLSHGNR